MGRAGSADAARRHAIINRRWRGRRRRVAGAAQIRLRQDPGLMKDASRSGTDVTVKSEGRRPFAAMTKSSWELGAASPAHRQPLQLWPQRAGPVRRSPAPRRRACSSAEHRARAAALAAVPAGDRGVGDGADPARAAVQRAASLSVEPTSSWRPGWPTRGLRLDGAPSSSVTSPPTTDGPSRLLVAPASSPRGSLPRAGHGRRGGAGSRRQVEGRTIYQVDDAAARCLRLRPDRHGRVSASRELVVPRWPGRSDDPEMKGLVDRAMAPLAAGGRAGSAGPGHRGGSPRPHRVPAPTPSGCKPAAPSWPTTTPRLESPESHRRWSRSPLAAAWGRWPAHLGPAGGAPSASPATPRSKRSPRPHCTGGARCGMHPAAAPMLARH
jgi:hypothetical protein